MGIAAVWQEKMKLVAIGTITDRGIATGIRGFAAGDTGKHSYGKLKFYKENAPRIRSVSGD